MSSHHHRKPFYERYLDPASRLGEVLFGLIMVLTATLTASLNVVEGKPGVRQLLFSAIGCNIAWGIIDGIMYIMNCLVERAANVRLIQAIHKAPNPTTALEIVRAKVDAEFEALSANEEREALCLAVLKHALHARPRPVSVHKEDLYSALACFWLVFFSCLPAAIPFLVFSNPTLALRVSNGLLIAMLFLVGQKWAQYAHTNRVAAGTIMVVIGLALVGVAILLGG